MVKARNKEKYNAYQREYQLKRYHRRKQEAIEYLGGRCVKCGTKDDLQFDHINEEEKSFTIGTLWSI